MSIHVLYILIFLAGLAQIGLVIGSTAIPRLLNWKSELAKTSLLIRQMFWTYAGYILVINLSFGLLSVFGVKELVDRSFLATVVTLFIAIYWISRILIQFFYFDTSAAPKGLIYKLGEIILVALFGFFSVAYSLAFLYNISS
jgi:hypothetical protein